MASTLIMAGHNEQDLHSFFRPKQSFDLDGRSSLDLEVSPRKRQRTRSPDNSIAVVASWEHGQSTGAPDNVHERSDGCQIDARNEPQQCADDVVVRPQDDLDASLPEHQALGTPPNADSTTPTTTTPRKKMMKVRRDGKLASPRTSVRIAEVEDENLPVKLAPTEEGSIKVPKKVLKISANGTLHALNSEPSIETTRRRGRKPKPERISVEKPTCIAIMTYEVADGIESSIGRRVDEIMQGKGTKQDVKTIQPAGPPKSTHPFFTGELGRTVKPDALPTGGPRPISTDSSGSRTQQAISSRVCPGPRESRITSKPPSAGQASNADYEGSFPAFGTDHAKVTRFPGAREPLWPPYEMVQVGRSPVDAGVIIDASEEIHAIEEGRKLKDTQIRIHPEENILKGLAVLADLHQDHGNLKMPVRDARQFRRPRRKVMTGTNLQQAIRSRLLYPLLDRSINCDQMEDELSSSQPFNNNSHNALLHLDTQLPSSRSAFDEFRCETQEWAHKYAPIRAELVLQQGREAELLRNWLKGLFVSSVGTGGESHSRTSSVMGRRLKISRKKRRKKEGLDDFVVSDDEVTDEMAEIPDAQNSDFAGSQEKKSVVRVGGSLKGERSANAVVISGPHGCGKTAAVFAVAKELDFEIFEVNAGSRRSGKDVLDKVGDMTRNHLVKHQQQDAEVAEVNEPDVDLLQQDDKLQADLESGRQGTMQSFFKVQPAKNVKAPQAKGASERPESRKGRKRKNILQEVLSKPRDQKQSLILLEEVDVLFEEDKLFWSTVLDLIARSKRPVVMTCSDESLLPLDDMALHAILRFAAPPTDLATDYLLLVAASEGHLLSRDAVQSLYEVKGSDLRASLAELNFFCQLGVGDSKGGLEWMLLDNPAQLMTSSDPLRVISEDTYCRGMGWLGGEDPSSQALQTLDEIIDLSTDIWNGWHVDPGATELLGPVSRLHRSPKSRVKSSHSLRVLDQSCGAFSAVDILPASVIRQSRSTTIDTDQLPLNERAKCNYIEGPKLLQADPLIDHTGTSDSIAFALRALAALTSEESQRPLINVRQVNQIIPLMLDCSKQPQLNLSKVTSAFQPIADDPSSTIAISKSMTISSFDSPLSTILQDVAPYVRAIISYDLRLEEQRRRLSALLMQHGVGNNKTRTTRASRAALEGGSKAETRRERWFPKQTNFNSILETGGKGWQKVAFEMSSKQSEKSNVDDQGSTQ